MPIYKRECSCGYKEETREPITSKRVIKCPQCGKMKLTKLIGAGAIFDLKGSGFFKGGIIAVAILLFISY